MKLPLISAKALDTRPYKDWLKHNGITEVYDEDYAMHIWEDWIRKTTRFGKNTKNSILYKTFPKQQFLKQVDVPVDTNRSSDINYQQLYYSDRCLKRQASQISLSEHAVRRWWEHTNTKPNILSWLNAFPQFNSIDQYYKDGEQITQLYHADGLLCGHLYQSRNQIEIINIDTKQVLVVPGIGFRVQTIIPVNILNEKQRFDWYKLKEAQK